ncbi:MAG: DUF5681 domain-containing protein [Terriglobia bacterium]
MHEKSGGTVETKKRGRIENLKPWKPGQSGNPGGRPKRDVAAEITRAVFEGNKEAIYRAMLKALKKGNPRVFKELAERGLGKVTQRVEIPGIENLAKQIAQARKRSLQQIAEARKRANDARQSNKR